MNKRVLWSCLAVAFFFVGVAFAQQFPVVDMVAGDLVQHYQQANCEQLWQERINRQGRPKSPREQEMINMLRQDAQMRAEFIGRVAAPIVNKEFECGMIP